MFLEIKTVMWTYRRGRRPKPFDFFPGMSDRFKGRGNTGLETVERVRAEMARERTRGGGVAPPTPPSTSKSTPTGRKRVGGDLSGVVKKQMVDSQVSSSKNNSMPGKSKSKSGARKSGKSTRKTRKSSKKSLKVKGRRQKARRMVKYQLKNGVNHTVEANFVNSTAEDVVWLGQHTFPQNMILRQGVKLLVKDLLQRAGVEVVSADAFLVNFGSGIDIVFEFKNGPLGITATAAYNITNVASNNLNAIVAWFMDSTRPWWLATNNDVYFTRMWMGGNATSGARPAADLSVANYICKFHVKNTLKMQNRTKNVDGTNDNTEESDVVPLIGKHYNCYGTELRLRKQHIGSLNPGVSAGHSVVGDMDYGYVSSGSGDTDNSFKEPPNGFAEFTNCRYTGKVYMYPGYVFTSSLTSSYNMLFNTLYKKVYGYTTPTASPLPLLRYVSDRRYGKARMFALEKQINSAPSAETAKWINVAFEINLEISATGYSKRSFSTVKSFQKELFV